jgi:membrane fusion protein (multidrug efflux system)
MFMQNKPTVVIVAILLAMLGYVYWPHNDEAGKGMRGGAANVEITPASLQVITNQITALGNAQAKESIVVTAQTTDRISEILFKDGDNIEKGQLLFTLDHREERAAVEDLEVTLAEHARQLKRLQDLKKQEASAESAIDAQRSLVESTQARLEIAKIKLQEKKIYAPFSGVLGLRQVSPGQLVTNNTTITTLDDLSEIRVEFNLPEKFLNEVAINQQVEAKNVAYKQAFIGQITAISPRVDKVTRAFTVRALFNNENGKLKPGMLLQLRINTASTEALVIPESSVVPMNDHHFVFVAENNKVKRVMVEIGRRYPGKVEVTSGIEPGQFVVSKGVMKLRDGAAIIPAVAQSNNG